ncbi:hypothetical protein Tco_0123268 [Tanacetum coccineum]
MIELWAEVELKDNLVVDTPKFEGERYTRSTIHFKYDWKPPRCSTCKVFDHVLDQCPKKTVSHVSKNLKMPRQASRSPLVSLKPNYNFVNRLVQPTNKTRGKSNSASTSGKKGKLDCLDKRKDIHPYCRTVLLTYKRLCWNGNALIVDDVGKARYIRDIFHVKFCAFKLIQSVSFPVEDDSDIGSPGVDGPPIMPEDPYAYIMAAYEVPPSLDYILGPEVPPSPDYLLGPEVLPSPDYIPGPEEEPEEDDEDPEEDPANYPADRDDDDEDEEEEHPALADSVLPVHRMTAMIYIRDEPSISLPPMEEVKRLLALTTLPPSLLTPLSTPLPQIPSPLTPLPQIPSQPLPIPITTSKSLLILMISKSCLHALEEVFLRFASPTIVIRSGSVQQPIHGFDLVGAIDVICIRYPMRGVIFGLLILATIVEEENTSICYVITYYGSGAECIDFRVTVSKSQEIEGDFRVIHIRPQETARDATQKWDDRYFRKRGAMKACAVVRKDGVCLQHKQLHSSMPGQICYVYPAREMLLHVGTPMLDHSTPEAWHHCNAMRRTLKKMLTDNICPRGEIRNLVRFKTCGNLKDAIEFATKLMDKKINTWAKRQADKQKESLDDIQEQQE